MQPVSGHDPRAAKHVDKPSRGAAGALALDRTLTVADLMSHDIVTLSADATLALAKDVMRIGRFRHIPVVDLDGCAVVGLVTHRDLLGAMARALAGFTAEERSWFGRERVARTLRVGDIMQLYPLTVTPQTRAYDAACMLRLNKFGCLPVVDADKLCGIITEADFVDLVAQAQNDHPEPTSSASQTEPA